ncbi:MAG: MBL fold metallo-hydrolase [Planctomycetota bacterium]
MTEDDPNPARPNDPTSRRKRIEASPHWRDGRFRDLLEREDPKGWSILRDWVLAKSPHRVPAEPIPTVRRTADDFREPPSSGLRVTWLGHSSSLVEIDGARVLLDPVFGKRVSPFAWAGPKRFFEPPMRASELPPLDAVAISHDHYDHLDRPTIVELSSLDVPFVVPLGVGAHLERWGVAPERITELDWWESHRVGPVTLTATPARHFSGRAMTMTDRDRTLWAGWALTGPEHRVYFSGDTAMFPGFAEIGERLGPFDAALVEAGAYSPLWRDVHIGPEQAVVACELVRGALLMPVHWGTFDLAMHAWTEPIERILAAAASAGVPVAAPRPGASFEPASAPAVERWWPELPWRGPAEDPVVSSGLAGALRERILRVGAAASAG